MSFPSSSSVGFLIIVVALSPHVRGDSGKRNEIVVNLKEQRLYAYENRREKFHFPCVIGDKEHPTVPGTFTIYRKHKDYRSKKYDAEMPYTMFFSKDGKASHAGFCCVQIESFV